MDKNRTPHFCNGCQQIYSMANIQTPRSASTACILIQIETMAQLGSLHQNHGESGASTQLNCHASLLSVLFFILSRGQMQK